MASCHFCCVEFRYRSHRRLESLIMKFKLASDWEAKGFSLESAMALMDSVAGVGALVGGIGVSLWGGLRERRIYGVLIPIIGAGIAQIIYGMSGTFYLALAMAFVRSLATPVMNPHSQTIWQTYAPPEFQGRVFSVRRVIAQFTAPIGTFVGGWLAGTINPSVLLVILGIMAAGFAGV